jgi:hypothetical protein
MLMTCGKKIQGRNNHIRKDIQNLPTCVAMRNHFNIANFDTLPRAKFIYLFIMKCFSQHLLYVNNMCAKFEGQKFYTKEDFYNPPTCVVVGTMGETISLLQLGHPPKR